MEPDEPDELMYDDFFREDNDFGSDAEEDGISTSISRCLVSKSVAGPRFIQVSPVYHDSTGAIGTISPSNKSSSETFPVVAYTVDAEGNYIRCLESDKDISRLKNYLTVIYPEPEGDTAAGIVNSGSDSVVKGEGGVEASSNDKARSVSREQVICVNLV